MPLARNPVRALREKWKHRRGADPAARTEKAARRAAGQAQHREHSTMKEGSSTHSGGGPV
jgi:Arc/MetJ-type ribon-helix-helix transcriptional regulator